MDLNSEMLAEEARPHLLRLFDTVADYAENIQRQGVDDEFSHSRLRKDAYDYHRVLRISKPIVKLFWRTRQSMSNSTSASRFRRMNGWEKNGGWQDTAPAS